MEWLLTLTTETKTVQSGRTRVYGVHISGPAAAGVLEFKDGGTGGTSKVKINKGAHIHDFTVNFPVPILFKTNVLLCFYYRTDYGYYCLSQWWKQLGGLSGFLRHNYIRENFLDR